VHTFDAAHTINNDDVEAFVFKLIDRSDIIVEKKLASVKPP